MITTIVEKQSEYDNWMRMHVGRSSGFCKVWWWAVQQLDWHRSKKGRGGSRGRVQGCAPPRMTCGFLIQLVFCKKRKTSMWFIGVEVEQETSAPYPKKILDPLLKGRHQASQAPSHGQPLSCGCCVFLLRSLILAGNNLFFLISTCLTNCIIPLLTS